ncbi:MAG TPA: N-6 DNA methylase [Spirochaetota bacterium]|nr:N-6 DNA methylase [Spirochaetota bacterium]HPK57430.1 N-6 DNA methylase [Spirochaetota bacterium]
MNITQIEENLQKLMKSFNKETFIFDLLLSYGLPKASISRLQNGNLNLSKNEGEISWKKKVFFRPVKKADLQAELTEIEKNIKHEQRFVIVTDFKNLLALDIKTRDKLDIELKELPRRFDFFLPWAGMEKAQHVNENPADVKAAAKMAKLFDEIKKDNPDNSPEFIHGMNVFLSRLLFCFFAEDTNIFAESQFTNSIDSHTQSDGSDLHDYLDKLFEVLNTPENNRKGLPAYLNAFPYVNGGLFAKKMPAPKFSRRSRQAIIDGGELQWKELNPDIFGSMFQAVVSPDQRGNLGQHYTSVPNIMKVIEPLFLNELYDEFEKAKSNQKKLNALLERLGKIKIFDPACGSGNFLIIAYKELRRLEMKILTYEQNKYKIGAMVSSTINLSQFFGIEIDDFAHEIAQLSLWLAEHQMNVEFFNQFGRTNPTLPLREAGNIVRGNACRLDWEEVCPKQKDDEIYVMGNPPYLGSKEQNSNQKSDLDLVFKDWSGYKKLDYVANWIKLGIDYIYQSKCKCSFVSTNSIIMGEQVPIFWPYLLEKNEEIFFAHKSFKWNNNAKKNAGVTVVILGIQNYNNKSKKYLFDQNRKSLVNNISPYLTSGSSLIISPRHSPLSCLPIMERGSQPTDNGNLIFSKVEYEYFIKVYPKSCHLFKKYMGADDLLYGIERYCLWLVDNDDWKNYSELVKRIEACKNFRLNSKKEGTRKKASIPHLFDEIKYRNSESIIFPVITSEKREYIPIKFLSSDCVISNKGQAIYDVNYWIFSVLTSKIHNAWTQVFAGRMETRIQYSNTLCYNTFPFPPITETQKEELTMCALRILSERENHPEKTLAELYDPDKMPDGLREAHRANDLAVERCYRSKPFESDEERLEYLFKLYEQMIEEEKNAGSLFAAEPKPNKYRTRK